MNLSDERLRKIAMDTALVLAPVFQREGWTWLETVGVPGLEDIADVLVRRLQWLRDWVENAGGEQNISYPLVSDSSGRLHVEYNADHEITVLLQLGVHYAGNDYKAEEDQ